MGTNNRTKVTVQAVVQESEKVWSYWTEPEHITKWNQASEDWYHRGRRMICEMVESWSYPCQVDMNKKTISCYGRFSVFYRGTVVYFLLKAFEVIK